MQVGVLRRNLSRIADTARHELNITEEPNTTLALVIGYVALDENFWNYILLLHVFIKKFASALEMNKNWFACLILKGFPP